MRVKILFTIIFIMMLSACMRKEDSIPLENNPASVNQNGISTAANLLLPASEKLYTKGTDVKDSTSTVLFKWDTAANAASYKLVVRNLLNQTELSQNTSDTALGMTLKQNTPYSWYVVSLSKDSSQQIKSETRRFYNSGDGVGNYAPFPADSLSPKMGEGFFPSDTKKITFSWHGFDVDDEVLNYDLYFGTDSLDLKKIEAGLVESQYADVSVQSDSTYYWKVVTNDPSGNTSVTPIYHFKIRSVANPHELSVDSLYPENGTIFPAKDTAIIALSWKSYDELEDSLSYDVYIGTDSADLDRVATEITADSYDDLSIHSDSTYYWKVVAYDKAGQSYSSDIVHFRVRRVIPPHTLYPATSLFPEDGKEIVANKTPVTLSWKGHDDQGDIIDYDVYFGTDSTALSPLGMGIKQEQYPNVSVNAGTTYYWQVVSHDKAGDSSITEIYTFNIGSVMSTTPLYWDVTDNSEITGQPYYGVENHDFSKDDLPSYINDEVANYFPTYTYSEGANFVNNDYLAIPLGVRRSEWIEFTTPEVKAGKYNVWICYRSAGKDKKIAITVDRDTLIKNFNFHEYMPKLGENGIFSEADLEQEGWKFYTSPIARNFAGRLVGTVSFNKDGTHKVRFIVDFDHSDTGGANWLDMIQFIPVQMDQIYPKFATDGNPVNKP